MWRPSPPQRGVEGTTSLQGVEGRLSADEREYQADSLRDEEEATYSQSTNESEQICGDRQDTPYTYYRGSDGYGKEVIE